jgi:hypothetical protein
MSSAWIKTNKTSCIKTYLIPNYSTYINTTVMAPLKISHRHCSAVFITPASSTFIIFVLSGDLANSQAFKLPNPLIWAQLSCIPCNASVYTASHQVSKHTNMLHLNNWQTSRYSSHFIQPHRFITNFTKAQVTSYFPFFRVTFIISNNKPSRL